MLNILMSANKKPCVNRLLWRLMVMLWIMHFSHTHGFAQNSIPSVATNSYSPMTKKERWSQYVNDNFVSQGAYFRAFGASLGDSTASKPVEWGGPPERYSLNFASQFARFTISGTVQSSMAAALGYDTRYHRCNCTGGWKRTEHALSRTFVTYDSSGRRKFDLPGLSGIYAGSIPMMDWYPRGYSPLTNGVRNGNIAVGVTAGIYLIREFSPKLRNKLYK